MGSASAGMTMVLLRPHTPLTRARYAGIWGVEDRYSNWSHWQTPQEERHHHHLNAFHCSRATGVEHCLNLRRCLRTIGTAHPLVQHGNVDDSVYVFPPAFQRNSKPPGIRTRQMSTICATASQPPAETSFSPSLHERIQRSHFSGTQNALTAPAHVTMQHSFQKRKPSRCMALCFARPSRDARNSPSGVSFAGERDPDTPERTI